MKFQRFTTAVIDNFTFVKVLKPSRIGLYPVQRHKLPGKKVKPMSGNAMSTRSFLANDQDSTKHNILLIPTYGHVLMVCI